MSSSPTHPEPPPPGRPGSRLVVLGALVLAVAGVVLIVVAPSRSNLPLGVLRVTAAARPAKLPPLWEHLASFSVAEQLTGPGSPNRTFERWNVGGTDLGFTFFHEGDLYMVFGDTFGREHGDWRSNTMAKIATIDTPANGLPIERFISDASGRAVELLSSKKVYWVERTVIPTSGISVGHRMVLHYMSVRRWLRPGRWIINHAGLAYSDDDGQTWTKTGALWDSSTNFAEVAFVRPDEDHEHVYLFGIPSGRYGGVKLARVPAERILRIGAYEYWDGEGWAPSEEQGTRVVPAPVGEMSV
ncbi:MAG TPA: DUF4185 domain-containing protein, partial [Longimicrobiales bacterium]|nr:DUF4185 domain-containing protein [Longimicrobiales bacterium]